MGLLLPLRHKMCTILHAFEKPYDLDEIEESSGLRGKGRKVHNWIYDLFSASFQNDGRVDAALKKSGKLYFFVGEDYLRVDVSDYTVDYTYRIRDKWFFGSKAKEFNSNLSAAVYYHGNQAFFFKGNRYLLYDMGARKPVAGYPKDLAEFPGDPFGGNIPTAAFNPSRGKLYIFYRDWANGDGELMIVRYDYESDTVDYNKSVCDWPGEGVFACDPLWNGWYDIDAAVDCPKECSGYPKGFFFTKQDDEAYFKTYYYSPFSCSRY